MSVPATKPQAATQPRCCNDRRIVASGFPPTVSTPPPSASGAGDGRYCQIHRRDQVRAGAKFLSHSSCSRLSGDSFDLIAQLRKNRDCDRTHAASRTSHNNRTAIGPIPRATIAATHCAAVKPRCRKSWFREARVRSEAARSTPPALAQIPRIRPNGRTQVVTRNNDLITRAVIGRRAFFHSAGAVDARHMRQDSHDTRVPLRCQRVLVVQRRIRNTNDTSPAGNSSTVKRSTREVTCPSRLCERQMPETIRVFHLLGL